MGSILLCEEFTLSIITEIITVNTLLVIKKIESKTRSCFRGTPLMLTWHNFMVIFTTTHISISIPTQEGGALWGQYAMAVSRCSLYLWCLPSAVAAAQCTLGYPWLAMSEAVSCKMSQPGTAVLFFSVFSSSP